MRHNISGRKLNRKTSHRLALLKNLSKSLILHEQIETTLPKAKDLRPFVEKILTIGKTNSLAAKRKVFSYLRDQKIVDKIFNVLAKRYQKRSGGYTRILKSGYRYGDSSPQAIIELVERDIKAKGLEDKERRKKDIQEPNQQNDKSISSEKVTTAIKEDKKKVKEQNLKKAEAPSIEEKK